MKFTTWYEILVQMNVVMVLCILLAEPCKPPEKFDSKITSHNIRLCRNSERIGPPYDCMWVKFSWSICDCPFESCTIHTIGIFCLIHCLSCTYQDFVPLALKIHLDINGVICAVGFIFYCNSLSIIMQF